MSSRCSVVEENVVCTDIAAERVFLEGLQQHSALAVDYHQRYPGHYTPIALGLPALSAVVFRIAHLLCPKRTVPRSGR